MAPLLATAALWPVMVEARPRPAHGGKRPSPAVLAGQPNPALWRISDRDTTIYLFGTLHALPKDLRWQSRTLIRVVAASDTLMTESVGERAATDAFDGKIAPQNLPPIGERVSKSHRAALARFADDLPVPAIKLLDGLPTWIVAMSVGFVREYRTGAVRGPGADDWLEQRFRAKRKKIVSIEDGRTALAAVNAIPESEQRKMLEAALDAPMPTLEGLRAPARAWAAGDVTAASPLATALRITDANTALDARLIGDRNRAWAATLEARLAHPGTILFAGGIAHFIGDASVLTLLKQRGIQVTRIR